MSVQSLAPSRSKSLTSSLTNLKGVLLMPPPSKQAAIPAPSGMATGGARWAQYQLPAAPPAQHGTYWQPIPSSGDRRSRLGPQARPSPVADPTGNPRPPRLPSGAVPWLSSTAGSTTGLARLEMEAPPTQSERRRGRANRLTGDFTARKAGRDQSDQPHPQAKPQPPRSRAARTVARRP